MSAIPGSFRSLIDHSASQGQGVQRQHIGAKILWILMMILAPFLCPVYLIVAVCWICLIGGRMSADAKVTVFVMMVFFGISWIPLVSLIIYLRHERQDQTATVNGITPIVAYYMFTIWGIVVAFRRFKLTDTYEIETSRRDVACLKDIVIEPRPIPIPGAREMVKAMKAAQAERHANFAANAPWYRRLLSWLGLADLSQGGRAMSSNVTDSNYRHLGSEAGGSDHSVSVPGMMQKEPRDIVGDDKHAGANASPRHPSDNLTEQSATFVPPSDDDGLEETNVTVNTVTEIANGLELYVHLKGKPKYVKVAACTALTLAGGTVIIVRTFTAHDGEQDVLWYLSTIFFCGMFLVFYAVFALIVVMYLNQVQFIQRLTSAICGDRDNGIAWVRAHNLSHLRAWEAVRRLAVLEITNPDSVLNALFTPSMFLSSLACLLIAAYLVLRLLFMGVEVGPFITTLLVLFVLLLSFIILVTGVANYAQSHLKLHTSIIAQKTYEIARLIDEKYSDIERGLLIDTADTNTEVASFGGTETDFSRSSLGSRGRRNTNLTNWEQGPLTEDDIDELRNTLLVRNSSLADPAQARAQLEMLLQERGGKMTRKVAAQPAAPRREESVAGDATFAPVVTNRSTIQLPSYFQAVPGTMAVGFGAADPKAVAGVIKQQTQAAQGAFQAGSARRMESDMESRHGHYAAAEYDDHDGTDDASVHGYHRHRADRDIDGVEKLTIAALESCHASLLSLCNYFVANQPRPLILGMQLQNVRYAIVFVLLISGNLMFLALMIAFKRDLCNSKP